VIVAVSVTLRVPSALQSPGETEIEPVGQLTCWHSNTPVKVALHAEFDAHSAMTAMFLLQEQVAGTSTAHEPPELKVVALTGPPPQSTTTTTSYLIGAQGDVTGSQSPDSVPVTWILLVVEPPPIGIPTTDVIVMEHAMATSLADPVYYNWSDPVIIQINELDHWSRIGAQALARSGKPELSEIQLQPEPGNDPGELSVD
jgi:hypothetical protein